MVSPLATLGHLFTLVYLVVYKMLITCRMMTGKKNLISKRNQHHIPNSKYLTCQWSVSCGMNKPKQCSKAFPLYVCTSKGNVLISVIYRAHHNLRLGLLNMKMRYIKIFLNQCSIQGKQIIMIKYEIELARHILV